MTNDATDRPRAPDALAEPRPPAWIFVGGALLTLVAGFVNAVTIALGYLPVTHLTGSVSQASGDAARGEIAHAAPIAAIVGAFVTGAALSGILVGDDRLRGGRPYGLVLLVEAACLAAAALLFDRSPLAALALAALAAGLQNAMASTYGRLILRTTHVTGIFTDIGLLLGRRLRGRTCEPWKFGLLTLLLVAFVGGGSAGWVAASGHGAGVLALPAIGLAVAGTGYRRLRRRLVADERRRERVGRPPSVSSAP